MKESAPERGAGSDESHRATDLWQDSPSGTPWPGVVRTSSSNGEDNQSYPVSVEVSLAPNAAVCGSLGCRETGPLLSISVVGEDRVLCPDCATDFARSQSERGLDSAERSPEGEPEARGSGKSDGKRSDQSVTSGGSCGVGHE